MAEDEFRDLAILRVRSTKLPEPLKLSSPQPPRETSQVWVLGFPFGEMLATSKLHPSMTITTGTITSLRLDDFGKVMRVQVDADINEGNSGTFGTGGRTIQMDAAGASGGAIFQRHRRAAQHCAAGETR